MMSVSDLQVDGQSVAGATPLFAVTPVASVAISPATGNVAVGQTLQLTATPMDAAGNVLTDRPISWRSRDASIATVSSNGLMTALRAGTANIVASVQGQIATASIVVGAAPAAVASVAVTPASGTVMVGQTIDLAAVARDANNNVLTGRPVTWTSLNPSVATVSSTGQVTGVAGGQASVVATVEGQSGQSAITVTVPPAPVASVAVTPGSGSLLVGQSLDLTAVARDASGNILTGRGVQWSSSNAAIATVSGTGVVTGVAAGQATVVATVEGQTGSAAITVSVAPSTGTVANVTVTPSTGSVGIGQTLQLAAVARDANGNVITGRAVSWRVRDASIAVVNTNGVLSGLAQGTANVVATVDGIAGTASITVGATSTPTVATVSVSPATATLAVGQSVDLTAVARDANGNVVTGRPVSWSTANAAIANVSTTGVVTGVAAGQTTVVATVDGRTASATITVNAPAPVPVASVTVSPSTGSVLVGQTLDLTAVARDANGNVLTGRAVTWSSSNAGIATVNGTGLVAGISAGQATIVANVEGRTGSAAITVTAPTTPPPTGGIVLFFSDWRTRLGTSLDAMSDGGKWNSMSADANQNGSIIDAPSGFPTHKVLRVASNGTRDGWLAPTVTTLGEIPIGSTRNYRWYHAFHEPATADRGQHPIQDGGSVSQSNWFMSTTNNGSNLASGQWGLDYAFGGNADWNTNKFTLGSREFVFTPLTKGRVYRHEIQVVRISATQFRFHAWVYDAAGNLLYDDDDFRSRDGTSSLATHVHTFQNTASMSAFLIGLNGIGSSPTWPIHSSDQAAIAIVQGLAERQPIGAYGSVTGEIRR